jgi:ribosomal protein S18 acetylase RimI-like enzyme
MDIRVLRPSDIPHVQLANITNLPENYFCKYYLYHAMSWPQLSYVAVDVSFVILITWGENGLPLHGTGAKRTQKKRSKRAREPILERRRKD